MAKVELTDVEKWMKRLSKKGPFYLYKTTPYYSSITPYRMVDGVKVELEPVVREGSNYFVIWNDGHKTKYGYVRDHMLCRYGIETCCVLNGETKFDLWNGSTIDDDIFDMMLLVRDPTVEDKQMQRFTLDQLKHLSW